MNFVAVWALTKKELVRFLRVPGQTIGAPIVTTALYFIIFTFSIGRSVEVINGLEYGQFIMPGLIMMNIMISSLTSVSSALMLSKVMNTLSDILVSPMSYLEIVLGYSLASVIRSVFIGSLIYGTALFFIPFGVANPLYLFSFLIIIAMAFSLAGLIIGIWAENFEQISIFPTFLITPLSFLGGIFYSIEMLPPVFQTIAKFNPILYLINGMRFGFYGVSDVNPYLAYGIGVAFLIVLMTITWNLFRTGYKIKT